jgi:hypothetical protein
MSAAPTREAECVRRAGRPDRCRSGARRPRAVRERAQTLENKEVFFSPALSDANTARMNSLVPNTTRLVCVDLSPPPPFRLTVLNWHHSRLAQLRFTTPFANTDTSKLYQADSSPPPPFGPANHNSRRHEPENVRRQARRPKGGRPL